MATNQQQRSAGTNPADILRGKRNLLEPKTDELNFDGDESVSKDQNGPEVTSKVINPEQRKTKFLRVPGVRGQFSSVHFGDDFVTSEPVTEEEEEKIKNYFKVDVEELDEHPTKKKV